MTTQNIGVFQAMGAKMDYLNLRQRVISQNIANADTPNYRPQDLTEVDFGEVLGKLESRDQIRLDRTDNGHMILGGGDIDNPRSSKQRQTYEVAPAGNAVIMEEQLMKAGQTVSDYNLMANLYQKNIGMIRTAIGTGR